ncbi:MAG: hypothetical protein N3G80_04390 [Candidatus Micrarchaeota archaeon]|nr:hypothetical protein [Candidatus Micrarchaeota archaeon]
MPKLKQNISPAQAIARLEKFIGKKDAQELVSKVVQSEGNAKITIQRELSLIVPPSPFYRYFLEGLTFGLIKTKEHKIQKILLSLDPKKKDE